MLQSSVNSEVLEFILPSLMVRRKNLLAGVPQEETVDGVTRAFLPADRGFEHGFDPLEGGFRAGSVEPYELFDQWIEVSPTDQVVAVQVSYDPKTGLQI